MKTEKIIKYILLALGGVAVFYAWKKFSGGRAGATTSADSLRTTGSAGDGFLNFYPGWRRVPTPSAQNNQSQSSQIPALITTGTNALVTVVGGIRNLFGGGRSGDYSTPAADNADSIYSDYSTPAADNADSVYDWNSAPSFDWSYDSLA